MFQTLSQLHSILSYNIIGKSSWQQIRNNKYKNLIVNPYLDFYNLEMKFKDQFYIILSAIFIASLITCNLIANKFVTVDLGFKVFIKLALHLRKSKNYIFLL